MNSARRSMADSILENCGHCTLHGELLCTRRCTIAVPNVIRITSANEDMFHPPSVCLSVCLEQFHMKTADRIFMKILPDKKVTTKF